MSQTTAGATAVSMSPIQELVHALKDRRAILFAGAGVSINAGLPPWRELIARMGREFGFDEGLRYGLGVDYPVLAEYYRLRQGSIGPLRSWMDRNWCVSEQRIRESKVHELIVQLDFPIIYTTNYDRNLEVAYALYDRDFIKVINARDMAKTVEGVTQIIKFHGDFDDDQSLVITESDYFRRLSFDSPLDIKFRSDAFGKTILFIGYSMHDMNIRLLLHRLWQTWRQSGYEVDRPQSFVFMIERNPVEEAVLNQWGIRVLSEEAETPDRALVSFLTKLREGLEEARAGQFP
ncbi:SIR2 family protein [Skermanella rosea]|uniref:SIR2 family protein n=1 Tax=Skermanella rosea TaxID=1817965 RepID=UPI0019311994|nr:SIR2 family protein [Skermanella rosea]UEM02393.1 SIR2 family protein [Skermanella rosea]